ncbi:GDSL esterase/lipase At5g55050-like [Dioscorea cayenensis subsp. rotundata]|uniref:GDSL esterase/lipase At5g55050-like n=1 Tax=Dioscorea cayennensis subsp. rotundata TaxID=55577 RepID=A0AB40CIK3_DIOCR|nr:GDSL esterase/lipase At5g55050-like [Dioscorea cayenensis subsp. rotundata]
MQYSSKMDSSASLYLVTLLSLCCMLFRFSNVAAVQYGSSQPTALFVFGASLLDVGNNNYLFTLKRCDFPHYGIDFPGGKPTGRCSNGKNIPDFLADKMGVPSPKSYMSLNRSMEPGKFLEGVNFASSSAGILNTTHKGLCIPLDTQIDYYSFVVEDLEESMGIVWTKCFISNSIFIVNIGSNDVQVYDGTGISNFVSLLISTLEGQLERLYNLGARKFAFMGLEPVGCWPALRAVNKSTGNCNSEVNQISVRYNEQAAVLLHEMQSKHADINYSFFNTYGIFTQYINDPQTYGFGNVTAACCGMGFLRAEIACNPLASYCSNRTEYLFWDGWHQTEATAKLLVNTAFDGSPPDVFPVNVRQLSGIGLQAEINAHVTPL